MLMAFGMVVCSAGLAVGYGAKEYIDSVLSNKLVGAFCEAHSSGFNEFAAKIEDDDFVSYDLTLFNVENPGGMLAGDKPELTETKPFRYKKYTYNVDITFPSIGTYKDSSGLVIEYADDAARLKAPINTMSGGYLTLLTTAQGETKLAVGLSGCKGTCIAKIQEIGALAATDLAAAAAALPDVLLDCQADLSSQGISIATPTSQALVQAAFTGLSQLAAQCVNVGSARLAYYNCIDGGRTISAGPDYSKCSDIQAIALAPAGTANFAKALSAEQKVSGLVLERSVEEAASGYANALQGSAQMALTCQHTTAALVRQQRRSWRLLCRRLNHTPKWYVMQRRQLCLLTQVREAAAAAAAAVVERPQGRLQWLVTVLHCLALHRRACQSKVQAASALHQVMS